VTSDNRYQNRYRSFPFFRSCSLSSLGVGIAIGIGIDLLPSTVAIHLFMSKGHRRLLAFDPDSDSDPDPDSDPDSDSDPDPDSDSDPDSNPDRTLICQHGFDGFAQVKFGVQ